MQGFNLLDLLIQFQRLQMLIYVQNGSNILHQHEIIKLGFYIYRELSELIIHILQNKIVKLNGRFEEFECPWDRHCDIIRRKTHHRMLELWSDLFHSLSGQFFSPISLSSFQKGRGFLITFMPLLMFHLANLDMLASSSCFCCC